MLKQQTFRCNISQKVFIILIAGILINLASAGPVITFNNNGAWCWFQDERAIVNDGKLIIGSVANSSGTGGSARNGDIEVVTYDISLGGTPDKFTLHDALQADDHAAPAFLVRPDGRILAVYAKHGSDNYIRYRITTNPNDTSAWGSEMTHNRGVGVTYSNVYRLSAENGGSGRIYDFYRGENYNPNFVTSDDNGQTWTYGLPGISTDGRLIAIGTGGTRPYVKYTSNNVDEIHFITTEAHPRNYDNSIYYGYLYDGNIYSADGTWLHDTATGGIAPQSLEKIYQGGSSNVAWTTDIALDDNGYPYFAFSIQVTSSDLRYGYARWDGSQWHTNEIAYAGTSLYSAESDYTGLVALDPNDPNVLYISTDAVPETGDPLISTADGQRHYEIFKGTTADMGATWVWEYITKNSTEDNIRPIIPKWDGGTILLWLRGTYYTYTNWDTDIVGMINPVPYESNEPVIELQPLSTGVPLGKTATFDVYATSPLPSMSYAWYKVNPGGSDISVGTDSDILVISNVQQSDVGQYYCIVTNTAGSTTSDSASLMIADLNAYWPLDSNYIDMTGNGHDASAVGSPSFTTGHEGQAVSFDGSSYLNCQDSNNLTFNDGGTVSAWIKTSSLSNAWASVVTKGQYGWRLCRNNSSNYISFLINSSSGDYQANGDIDVVDNNWHHVAATYDGLKIALYIDGELDATATTTEPINELSDPVYIGARLDTTAGTQVYVDAEGGSGGNTVRASDGNVNAWWTTTINSTDTLWARRSVYGNDENGAMGQANSDIFEATGNASPGEDAVQIITTITGLTPGSLYKVDVVYWSANYAEWCVQAGFSPGSLLYYNRTGSDSATAGTATGKTENDRIEYTGLVGYAQADVNGEIKVYVDDKPGGGTSHYDRTWYDGLIYEDVTGNQYPARFWDGLIDDVRIYSFAMDEDTIKLLYNGKSCYRLEPYDLNKDCRIDLGDLETFSKNWLASGINPVTSQCDAYPELDMTGPEGIPDCQVNLYEYSEMAMQWLDCYLIPTSMCNN